MFRNPSTFKKPYNSKYSTNLLQIKQEQTSVLVQRPLSKMDGKLNLSVSYAVDRKKTYIFTKTKHNNLANSWWCLPYKDFQKMKSGEVFCPFLKRTLPSPTLNKPASAHFSNCQLSRLSAICSFFLLLLKYSCGQVHKPWALAKTWFKTFCRTWDQECKKLGFFVTKK